MILNWERVAAGAVSGLLAAVWVDVDAWKKAPLAEPFDWKLAIRRWVAGAFAGALAAAGFGQVGA